MSTHSTMSRLAVARLIGVRSSTLREWGESGVGPLLGRRGRYSHPEVIAWAEEADYATEVNDNP